MTGHTAVGDRVVLNVGFRAARTRLHSLARGEMLQRASETAYGESVTTLAKLAGPTRLADVCLADLTEEEDCVHIALQWDAIAADGTLFTALLADLMLVPAGEQTSVLSLAGAYWPPPAPANAELGSVAVRRCVMAVTATFLDSVACKLTSEASSSRSHRPAAACPTTKRGRQS